MYYYGNDGTRRYFDCVIAVLDATGREEVSEPIVVTQAGAGDTAIATARRGAKRYIADQQRRLGLKLELVAVVDAGCSFAAATALAEWRLAHRLVVAVDD